MDCILLCASSDCASNPALLGLEDVDLEQLDWLQVETEATQCRKHAGNADVGEAWVESCDDMDALNVAAAIKYDNAEMPVFLIASDASGSLRSRAQSAGITGVLASDGFLRRFAIERERRLRVAEAADLSLDSIASKEITEKDNSKHASSGQIAAPDSKAQNTEMSRNALTVSDDFDITASIDEPKPIEHNDIAAAVTGPIEVPQIFTPGTIRKATNYTKRPGSAFVLTVLSGSGGAGKSTVSAVSAEIAASKGHSVLLFDCDLQFGDLSYMTGTKNALSADEALEDISQIEEMYNAVEDGGMTLLAAPSRLERAEVVSAHLPALLDAAASLFDVIVINTGASWAECHATLIERSDCALFLVDQKASSIRACKHAIDLCGRLGIASGSFAYAVNRCKRGAMFTSIDVACALQGAHVFELKDGGQEVEELLGAGFSGDLTATKNDLCTSVAGMLDELLPSKLSGKTRKSKRSKKADMVSGAHPAVINRKSRRRGAQNITLRKGKDWSVLAESGAERSIL